MSQLRVDPISNVAVCVATFRRPHGLSRLLDSLAELDKPAGVTIRVVVCDNDPDRSAVERYEQTPPDLPFAFDIIHQPERGVASVRNALVAASVELGCDGIAFVDDDEVVPPRWLANMIEIQHRTGASVITGPVVSVFEAEPPRWVEQLGYFDPIDCPDGQPSTFANSNNVLMHTDVLDGDTAPFDPRLNLTGGEDTHFFRRCIIAGHTVLWNSRESPSEYVPESKTTAEWMRQREYRRGTTRSFVLRDLDDSWLARFKRVVAGLAEFGRAGRDLLRALAQRDAASRKALTASAANQAWYGSGMIAGLFGASYSEYETTHGS